MAKRQRGLDPVVDEEIKEAANHNDMDEGCRALKKLADVCVLQIRVAIKSGDYNDRLAALDSLQRTASSLTTEARALLRRVGK